MATSATCRYPGARGPATHRVIEAAKRVNETCGFTLNVPGLDDGPRVFNGAAERKAAAEALRDLRDAISEYDGRTTEAK